MRFTISAAAFLAFAANVLAQNPDFDPVTKPTPNEKIDAGSTYTIEWTTPAAFKDVTVSISLIGGATQGGQVPLLDVASGIANSAGKYSWTIPSTLGKDAFYGLVIKSDVNPDVDFQFSNPFHIVAGEGASSGTTTLTSSAGTATVTLSAASVSTTASSTKAASTSAAETVIVNSTTALSTTAAPTAASSAPATIVTSVTRPASNGTATQTPATTLATVTAPGAGAQATAGVFAVLGGLAVAALF